MKRLLLASILMAFGAPAYAVVQVGPVNCVGDYPDITCTAALTCGTAGSTCDVQLDSGGATQALCQPLNDSAANDIIATNASNGFPPPATCTWTVTDTSDNDSISYTIDHSDGLPVELQSLSVD
jgi:hypothetical protein